jgi:small subunit ribosomal protein S4
MYGVLERQFRRYFERAERQRGVTGENLLLLLERRLDNMVYRLGFASSRAEARHLVRHGHFLVNRRRVTVPSYLVVQCDEVAVREKSKALGRVQESLELAQRRGLPEWLEMDREKMIGRVKEFPARDELTLPVNEKLVVELYSKV